jgi:hypothetical protein
MSARPSHVFAVSVVSVNNQVIIVKGLFGSMLA